MDAVLPEHILREVKAYNNQLYSSRVLYFQVDPMNVKNAICSFIKLLQYFPSSLLGSRETAMGTRVSNII